MKLKAIYNEETKKWVCTISYNINKVELTRDIIVDATPEASMKDIRKILFAGTRVDVEFAMYMLKIGVSNIAFIADTVYDIKKCLREENWVENLKEIDDESTKVEHQSIDDYMDSMKKAVEDLL